MTTTTEAPAGVVTASSDASGIRIVRVLDAPPELVFKCWTEPEHFAAWFGEHGSSMPVDTVTMARRKFPGAPASLDALCKRYEIDLSARKVHGALLDAELLADVYLELCGGRQAGMQLLTPGAAKAAAQAAAAAVALPARDFPVPEAELAAHESFLKQIKNAIWGKLKETVN